MRDAHNVNVVLAKVSGIDAERREVLAEGRRIAFDHLIVATHDEVQKPRAFDRIGLGLRLLECKQDAAPQIGSVVDSLEAGR
jgi:NADPH-dependent 2,4-dienoyl-CoA reductase/sulfur reductase-like enzyme